MRWALGVAILAAAACATVLRSDGAAVDDCLAQLQRHYPRQYVAYKTAVPPRIDGVIDGDPVWDEVGFAERFVDISTETRPEFTTEVKMRWDDTYLYVAAWVRDPHVWANITHTCHCVNASEDQVIFHDNDFEVFVDADATTHWYKEFEMNAANQNWNLLLDRPYEDGGYENSSRVFGAKGFDMTHMKPPLRSAVTVVNGTLNDPASRPKGWVAEIAFPLSTLAYKTTATVPPSNGDLWRINYSRVEWAVKVRDNKYYKDPSCQSCPVPGTATEDNWVWSPMMAIDIHHPELWGYLQFSDARVNTTEPVFDDTWPMRWAAHNLYYAQKALRTPDERYTDDIAAIAAAAQFPDSITGGCIVDPKVELTEGGKGYIATFGSNAVAGLTLTMTNLRRMTASHGNATATLAK